MNAIGTKAQIEKRIAACREDCRAKEIPFHADALAAALGLSYAALETLAAGKGRLAALLAAALQECTASVVSYTFSADPKQHAFLMWYLRNRAGFTDKAEPRQTGGAVTFIGEERIV